MSRGTPLATDLRLTAAAALATTSALLTLWPLFVHRDWLRAGLLAVLVVAVVAGLARALGVGRLTTLLLQVAALAVLVTVLFGDHAFAGLLPTSSTVSGLVDLARQGGNGIDQQAVPVVDQPGIVLIIAVGAGLAAAAVDFAAVACRCPVIAGVVLLAVYGVPAAVLPAGASWPWFVVAACGWLVLLYAVQRESVHEWGTRLSAGAGLWERVTSEPADPRAVLARRIGLGAVAAGVVVAALIPGLGDGMLDGVGTHGATGSGGAGNGPQHNVRLDLTATLRGNLSNPTDIPLLHYTTTATTPQYLRLTVLDRFDGTSWLPADQPADGPSVLGGVEKLSGTDVPNDTSSGSRTTVQAFGNASGLGYLPLPYDTTAVSIGTDGWQWDTSTATVFSRQDTLGSQSYDAYSVDVDPSAGALASNVLDPGDEAGYTVVPSGVPSVVRTTAETVTRGATGEYAQALALQNWFRDNFTYTLSTTGGDSSSAIVAFLTNKHGYCQQFAAAYALMARELAIPARVVVGFTPGTRDADGSYTVGTHDYHAWPEVWFANAGWVRFEPTPRSDGSVSVPAWADETVPAPVATQPSAAPSASTLARPQDKPSSPAQGRSRVASVARAAAPWHASRPGLGSLALVLLLVCLAAAPGTARAWRRRRRLGLPPGQAQVEAAWDELADTARDLGLAWHGEDTPRRAADALVRDARLEGASAVAVQELRRDVEEVRYAPTAARRPANAPLTAAREALNARSSWGARARAVLLPPTVLRRHRSDGRRR